jgi:pantothenate kinase
MLPDPVVSGPIESYASSTFESLHALRRPSALAPQHAREEGAMSQEEHLITLPDLANLLAERAGKGRNLIALVGPPGAGKSACAEWLAEGINATGRNRAGVFPMDGFHFDDLVLEARGLLPRKGAPETFDVAGLRHMLDRLRNNEEDEIAVPVFDRTLEIARAGARMIPSDVGVLIVEGNYLLLDYPPWSTLAPLFDLTVSIRVTEEELRRRLTERWRSQGMDADRIQAKVETNDLPNGRTVLVHSIAADFVLEN